MEFQFSLAVMGPTDLVMRLLSSRVQLARLRDDPAVSRSNRRSHQWPDSRLRGTCRHNPFGGHLRSTQYRAQLERSLFNVHTDLPQRDGVAIRQGFSCTAQATKGNKYLIRESFSTAKPPTLFHTLSVQTPDITLVLPNPTEDNNRWVSSSRIRHT